MDKINLNEESWTVETGKQVSYEKETTEPAGTKEQVHGFESLEEPEKPKKPEKTIKTPVLIAVAAAAVVIVAVCVVVMAMKRTGGGNDMSGVNEEFVSQPGILQEDDAPDDRSASPEGADGQTTPEKAAVPVTAQSGAAGTTAAEANASATASVRVTTTAPITTAAPVTTTAAQTTKKEPETVYVTVTFNANGGKVNQNSIKVAANGTYGDLPSATKDYNNFDGWYTASTGGTKVNGGTAVTNSSDHTLYAHWTEKPLSGWTLSSQVPSGAQTVERKWKYTLKETTTNSSSSLAGWTLVRQERTGWGAEQTAYSDPSNGVRNVRSEQYIDSYTHHWKYYHRYGIGRNVVTNQTGTIWSSDALLTTGVRHELDITYALSPGYKSSGSGLQYYKTYACPECGNDHMWLPDGEYDVPQYGTRWIYQEPVYTYYFERSTDKESNSNPSGNPNVSNVKEYVRYRSK